MHIVIIGSGIAGVGFAEKCQSLMANSVNAPVHEITIVTYEHDGYYSRPLLSRGFTKNEIEHSIILKSFDKIRANGINVISGAEVAAIDRQAKTIIINGSVQEKVLPYDKLVLAQGSEAFIPPPLRPFNSLFFCLNSLVDLKAIRLFRQSLLAADTQPHWAIVGGGLIGCELASDLAVAGDKVTVFHALDRLMERQLVPDDSRLLLEVLQTAGINVLFNQNVRSFARCGEKMTVQTDIVAEFDGVIVACGFKPRIDLAMQAGLTTGRGIKVNAFLQTNDEDIYALGDVAELPDGKLYAYILPIRSQANWLAGFMLGQEPTSWQPPYFTSKAKVHGFEAVHPYNM